jgi:uncharacterized membrane protein YagU involved in acid resistance
MTATTAHSTGSIDSLKTRAAAGAAGGLAGGMVFGMAMQAMGMIAMVAQLVGSTSAAVSWLVHLAISVVLGAGFALVVGRRLSTTATAAATGVGYGVIWWVLGALLLMPARPGMPTFQLDATAAKSLMGHMMYGAVLGLVAATVVRRSSTR